METYHMNNLSQQQKGQLVKNNHQKVSDLLEKMKGQLMLCIPKHMSVDRICRLAITEFRKNPMLGECEPLSFIAAVMQASQLGLEIGVLGSAYIVPFKNNKKGIIECNLIPGYRGLIDLSRRSGNIISISAEIVFENDIFEFEKGLDYKLIHKPALTNRGSMIAAYSVAKLKDGGAQFLVMSKEEIDEVKQKSKTPNGAWSTDYNAMAQKTVVRRLFKWLPSSIEMQKIAILDEQAEVGSQDIKSALSEDIDIDFLTYDNDTGEIMETKLEPQKEHVMSQADKIAEELKNKKV